MAAIQLKDLPVADPVENADILHIQTAGGVDKQVTKAVLLQELTAINSDIRYSELDNPLLHLFKKNKIEDTLAGSVTWIRSTTATYVDRYGIVKSAAIDTPREEADGWLIEGTSEGTILHSEDFNNAAWTKANSSVVSNTVTAPDGTMTADKIVENVVNTFHRFTQITTTTNGTSHTASCFAKKGERDFCFLYENVSGVGVIFDLVNGVTGSAVGGAPTSSKIESLADGWFRISMAFTTGSINPDVWIGTALDSSTASYTGDGASGVYLWGAGLEELPFASSYIPTVASSVTRTADSVSVVVEDNFLSSIQGDHSQFFNYKLLGDTGLGQKLYGSRSTLGSTSPFIAVVISSNGNVLCRDGSTVNQSLVAGGTFSDSHFLTIVTEAGVISSFLDGGAGSTAVLSPTDTIDLNETLQFGSDDSGGEPMYGHLSDFRIYDFALNSTEVEFLS